MAAIENLSEEEAYLYALLQDLSGIDQAELLLYDPQYDETDGCFRAYPYQYGLWRCTDVQQIEQLARDLGKTLGIMLSAFQFPFNYPGEEMAIVAPEFTHLEPVTRGLTDLIMSTRLTREMLKKSRGGPVTKRPFVLKFENNAKIVGKIPQNDGKGVKGCLVHDSLILTKEGIKPIQDVTTSDYVWSHLNRWSEVVEVQSFEDECFEVTGQGAFPTGMSQDHRFFGRWNEAVNLKQKRKLGKLTWHDVADLSEEDLKRTYWTGTCALPEDAEPFKVEVGDRGKTILDSHDENFAWLVGRYAADGCLRGDHGVTIVASPRYQENLRVRCGALGLTWNITGRSHSSADLFQINGRGLGEWLEENVGRLSGGKKVPAYLFSAPRSLKAAFLDGYWADGDGCDDRVEKSHRTTSSSASKALTLGVGLLAQDLGMSVGYRTQEINVSEINGVKLKKAPQPSHRVMCSRRGGLGVFEDGYVSYKVKKCRPLGVQPVYNIISEDHSYLANGVFHHNTHATVLHFEESQDLNRFAWKESQSALRRSRKNAMWKVHGVTRGVQDDFWKRSQPGSGWTVHRACLPEGTLVYGVNGPFEIQEALEGDLVWSITPEGRLVQKPITGTIDNGVQPLWEVRTSRGGYSLKTTSNHPYLVLRREGTRRTRRRLEFEWVEARDVVEGDYIIGVRSLDPSGHRDEYDLSLMPEMLSDRSPNREIPLTYSSVKDGVGLEGLDERLVARRVGSSQALPEQAHTYDITVDDTHNYIAEGVVVHNSAMNRPSWTAEEKANAIREYGSEDDPDYRRNILGEHGDSVHSLFIQNRLMKCCDDDPESWYNTHGFTNVIITDELLKDAGGDIRLLLADEIPAPPKDYGTIFWMGADIGFTRDPTEVIVFAEGTLTAEQKKYRRANEKKIPADGLTVLTMVARVQMKRISAPDQAKAFDWLVEHYEGLRALSMDSTGAGQPLVQFLEADYPHAAAKIKGYTFGSKVLIGYREVAEDEVLYDEDQEKESEIWKAPEIYAIDVMRTTLIDEGRLWFPFEPAIVQGFIGQTVSTIDFDSYGNRKMSKGPNSHVFDAMRMAVVGWKLNTIEKLAKAVDRAPVVDLLAEDFALDGLFETW